MRQLQKKQKSKKEDFFGTLGASLLGNMLADKEVLRAGEGTIRTGYGSKTSSLKNFDSSSSFNKLRNTSILSK